MHVLVIIIWGIAKQQTREQAEAPCAPKFWTFCAIGMSLLSHNLRPTVAVRPNCGMPLPVALRSPLRSQHGAKRSTPSLCHLQRIPTSSQRKQHTYARYGSGASQSLCALGFRSSYLLPQRDQFCNSAVNAVHTCRNFSSVKCRYLRGASGPVGRPWVCIAACKRGNKVVVAATLVRCSRSLAADSKPSVLQEGPAGRQLQAPSPSFDHLSLPVELPVLAEFLGQQSCLYLSHLLHVLGRCSSLS